MGPAPPSRSRLLAGLGVAWIAMSSAAIAIVYAQPVPPLVVATVRTAITAAAWALIGARTLGESWRALSRSPARCGLLVLAGLLLGAHFGTWITAVTETTVAHATVLVALQPLFAGLFGLLLGDRAGWRLYAGIGVALLGTAVLTGAASGSPSGSEATLLGDGLAVVAAAAAAAYLIAGRRVGKAVPLAGSLVLVNASASLALALAALATGESFAGPLGTEDVLAILWLGLVPGLVGHGLMNWSARHLPVHSVSVAVLLEPAGATFLAYVLLGEAVGPRELLGGGLLIASAWLALAEVEA